MIRRIWRGLWAIGAAALLAACAVSGPRSTTVSQDQLQALLAARFPYTGKLGPLFELKAQTPALRLLPQQNRIGTVVQLQVSERLGHATFDGVLDMDYGLRFEASDNSIRMDGVHVNSLQFAGVPERYQSLVQSLAPQLAERLMDGLALHQIRAKDLAAVNGLGYAPGSITVTPEGLRITLVPLNHANTPP